MRIIANDVTPLYGVRGFESLPLRHLLAFVVACGLALCSSSCLAQRTIEIDSTPPGAEVRLDDQLVGTTQPPGKEPLRVSFKDYGTRRFTLYKDGYVTYSKAIAIEPPWYEAFPLDVFSEILLPIGWHDTHHVHATLETGSGAIPASDLESVMQRAEALRRAGPTVPHLEPDAKPKPESNGGGAP